MPENEETKDTPVPEVKEPEIKVAGTERAKLEAEVEIRVERRYVQLFAIWKQDEFSKFVESQDKLIQENLQKYVEKWKADQKPPTVEEIQQLLDQEYLSFTVPIRAVDSDGDVQMETFTLFELPQRIEKKIYKMFRDKVMGKAGALAALTQASIDAPFETKLRNFLELFDESFEMMSEIVSLILNPFGKKQFKGQPITREWVQENVSSNRQWQIIEAQVQVNRIKDFFSKLSQSGQMTQITLEGLNYQTLLQQAR